MRASVLNIYKAEKGVLIEALCFEWMITKNGQRHIKTFTGFNLDFDLKWRWSPYLIICNFVIIK